MLCGYCQMKMSLLGNGVGSAAHRGVHGSGEDVVVVSWVWSGAGFRSIG